MQTATLTTNEVHRWECGEEQGVAVQGEGRAGRGVRVTGDNDCERTRDGVCDSSQVEVREHNKRVRVEGKASRKGEEKETKEKVEEVHVKRRRTRRGSKRQEITCRRKRGRGVVGKKAARVHKRRRKRGQRRRWRRTQSSKDGGRPHKEEGGEDRVEFMAKGSELAKQKPHGTGKGRRMMQIQGGSGGRSNKGVRATGPVRKTSRGSRRRRRARVAKRGREQGAIQLVIGVLLVLLVCSADAVGNGGRGQEMGMLSTVGMIGSVLFACVCGRKLTAAPDEEQGEDSTREEGAKLRGSSSGSGSGEGSGNGSAEEAHNRVQDEGGREEADDCMVDDEEEEEEARPTWAIPASNMSVGAPRWSAGSTSGWGTGSAGGSFEGGAGSAGVSSGWGTGPTRGSGWGKRAAGDSDGGAGSTGGQNVSTTRHTDFHAGGCDTGASVPRGQWSWGFQQVSHGRGYEHVRAYVRFVHIETWPDLTLGPLEIQYVPPPNQQDMRIKVVITCTAECRWRIEVSGCTIEQSTHEGEIRITRHPGMPCAKVF